MHASLELNLPGSLEATQGLSSIPCARRLCVSVSHTHTAAILNPSQQRLQDEAAQKAKALRELSYGYTLSLLPNRLFSVLKISCFSYAGKLVEGVKNDYTRVKVQSEKESE